MKNVVQLEEIREMEFRSQQVYEHYYQLLEKDIPVYFKGKELNERQTCPACSSTIYTNQFEKLSFLYRTCNNCGTMYVSHRAKDEDLYLYQNNSQSHRFFVKNYLADLERTKSKQILVSHINWIIDSVIEYDAPKLNYLDLRSRYPFLLFEIDNKNYFSNLFLTRPLFDMNLLTGAHFSEISSFKDNEDSSISVITAFDYLDSLFNPEEFIRQAYRILDKKGLLFLTTRCISGLDMQILWKQSRSILPPHHVTIFSIEGLICFFQANGFKICELSTPGQIDLDIIANSLKNDPTLKIPPFITYILEKRGKDTHYSFKEFLQKNRLSSYTSIVVQR